MGSVKDATPVVVYHDLDGPLQDQYYAALGTFIQRFTETEEDLVQNLQWFMSESAGGPHSQAVVHTLTAEMPLRYLFEYAQIIARDVLNYTKAELAEITKLRARMATLSELRNIVAHQPGYFSPFTEEPFAFYRQAREKEVKNFHTLYIGIDALEAASHDYPIAGYLYRCRLGRARPVEHQAPTWRYTPNLLTRVNHQNRKNGGPEPKAKK
jgi:hypothetical protein